MEGRFVLSSLNLQFYGKCAIIIIDFAKAKQNIYNSGGHNMFSQKFTCPEGKDTTKQDTCKGCRENGILKNVCAARCSAYKNHVRKSVK